MYEQSLTLDSMSRVSEYFQELIEKIENSDNNNDKFSIHSGRNFLKNNIKKQIVGFKP